MKNIFSILTIFLLISCSKNDSPDITLSHDFYENSKIELQNNSEVITKKINDGDNIVFSYNLINGGNSSMLDSGYNEYIVFEISSELENFSYSNAELLNQKVLYNSSCVLCTPSSDIIIEKGTISGTKIDYLTWQISINISFTKNGKSISKDTNTTFLNAIRHSI